MKKVLKGAMALAMAMSLTACSGSTTNNEKKVYKVGISQFTQHVALDAATKGFKDVLVEEFGEDGVEFKETNSGGDAANCATNANVLKNAKCDLILANATPALQACAEAVKNVPILGTAVTEYGVALNLKNFNGTVGTNVSGTSDLAPLNEQAASIKELFPNAKTVGVLYCSAEANSAYQYTTIKAELEKLGYKVNHATFSDSNDVSKTASDLASKNDVIYIPTDNTAAANTKAIYNAIKNTKTPVFAGEEGIASGCGVATLSISYNDLGRTTGEMAVKILKGEAKPEEMKIEYAPATKKYNKKLADEFGVTIPEGYEEIK